MNFPQTVKTKQPKLDAQSQIHLDGRNTILWDQCRLIWDSSSLVSSTAGSSEVRSSVAKYDLDEHPPRPSRLTGNGALGQRGTLVAESKEKLDFMLRLNYDFGSTKRYSIRVTTAPFEGGSVEITDLLYSDGGQEDAKAAYEKDVHEMTTASCSNGMQQALKQF
ncbi:MAG: hypothetical protein Q9172_006297 [Xanthocarpia lactea]